MANVMYTASKLAAGKKGILPPDADGYYTMPVGALNVFNSSGQYYVLEGAKQLFDSSSIFQRRVANGCSKGEMGHPKRDPKMTMDDYMTRILTIEETNVCCHFRKFWLDETFGKKNPQFKNPDMVAIMAELKPSGPMGPSLKESIENPHENVCFSIRSLTRDYYQRGQCYRILQQIVGFDAVTEPGLALATQWSAPALESQGDEYISKRNIESVIKHHANVAALESTIEMATESLRVFESANFKKPLSDKW